MSESTPRRVEHHQTDKGYVPVYTTAVVEQPWLDYSADDHATWGTLYACQRELLAGRACDEFVRGMQDLPIGPDQIPNFEQLSETLSQRTGWQIVAVPGLVPDDVFFEHLAHRRFPAGHFIRKPHELDYLEEPDVFHDVFGHVPMLMNPVMADYIQAYGQGGLRAKALGVLDKLARVYWYTVEFGLVQQADGIRILGAGIASSFTETVFALDDPSPHRIGFDLERVMRTQYRIDDFQETYFVIPHLDALLDLAHIDFASIYERTNGLPDYAPGTTLPSDHVLSRGTGQYHHTKHTTALP